MASILLTYVFSEDSCPVLVAQFGCILFALWKVYQNRKQKRTEDEMSQVGILPPSKPGEHVDLKSEDSVGTSSKSMVIQGRQHSREIQQLERHHQLVLQYPDNKACGDNTNNPPEKRPKLRVCSLRHVLELSAQGMPFIVKKSYRELQDDLKATRTGGINCPSMGEDEAATSHKEIRFGLTKYESIDVRAIQTIEGNMKQRIAKYDSNNRDSEDHGKISEQKNNTISKLKMCMLRHILEKSILDVPNVVRTSWQTHVRLRSGGPKEVKQQIFFSPLQSNSKTRQEAGPSLVSTNKPKNVPICPPEMGHISCMASGDFTSQGPPKIHTLHHQSTNPNVKSLHPSIPRYLKKVTKHYFKRSQRPSRKDYNVLTFALSKILFSHSNVEGPRIVKNSTPNLRMQRSDFLATHFRPRPVRKRVNGEEAKDLSNVKKEPQLFEETEQPSDEGPTSYSPKTTKPMKTCPGGRFNDVKCKPCSSGRPRDRPRGTIWEIFRQLVHFPCEDEFGTCFCLPQGTINQI